MRKNGPVILTILDGWGIRSETAGNAIALARKPTYDRLMREYPNTIIRASEKFVGLPDGQMGNSEVGHLNLGAGRVVVCATAAVRAATALRGGRTARRKPEPSTANDDWLVRHSGHRLGLLPLVRAAPRAAPPYAGQPAPLIGDGPCA